MNDWHRTLWAVLVAVVATSCGDGSNPTNTTSTTTSVRPVVTDVLLESSSSLRSNFFLTVPGRTQTAGQLEAIVDWTLADSVVYVYVADGACSANQFANINCPGPACECEFLAISEVTQPKPRVLTISNLAPQAFTLIIWNAGARDESVSWQVLLRSGGSFLRTSGSGSSSSSATDPSFERGSKAPPR